MSMISDLVDKLRVESKSMGKYGVDYMATLLMRSADTIEMLSEKARTDRPQGEWIYYTTVRGITDMYKCSECGNLSEGRSKFCKHCGCDMRKGADDE